jgi:hypothetical protein
VAVGHGADDGFGQPTSPASYQSPREFNFSVGFRF